MGDWMWVLMVTGFFFLLSMNLHAGVTAALGNKMSPWKTDVELIKDEAAEGTPAVVGRAVAVVGVKEEDYEVSYAPFMVAVPLAALYGFLVVQTRKFS